MFKTFKHLNFDKSHKSLTFISKRHFPRFVNPINKSINKDDLSEKDKETDENIKIKRTDFREDLKLREEARRLLKKKYDESGDDDSDKKYDKNYTTYQMAHCSETIVEIPEKLALMAKKVFSKHVAADVREWSKKYLIQYSQNHACEPPINLSIISKPFANSNEIDVKIKIFNKEDVSDEKIIEVKEDVEILGNKPNKDPEDSVNPIKILYEKPHSIAYMYSRMPYTYGSMKKILHEISLRMPNFKPSSILDYGAGLGSCILAAEEEFPSLQKLAAVEPNKNMRRLGKFLTNYLVKEIIWVDSLTMIPGTGVDRGKFDIILLGHVLQEIPTASLRKMIIDTLWNRLSPNGIFVILEPGSPKGFRFINDLRTWVIDKDRSEASLVAPCSNHNKCPFADKPNEWCHFSQQIYKYNKEVFPKKKTEKSIHNEKYSYLVIKKGKTPNVTLSTEEETNKPDEKSFFWHRVIRPIIKKHAHVIIDVCTNQGEIERRIISKSHSKEGGYKTAKKTKWGDMWYLPKWIPNKYRKENKKGKRLW